jgi:hypothetical protein
LSKEDRATLHLLHREIIMLKAGAKVVGTKWVGKCEWCGKVKPLMVCHILSQGKHPSMRYDIENAWAGCWACHLGPGGWHREPLKAAEWITQKRGAANIELLKMRAAQKQKKDFEGTRIYLKTVRDRLKGLPVSTLPDLRKPI